MTRPNTQWQTRLTFSPLPSSSPAAAKYPEQVQERAASVRYSSPHQRSGKRQTGNGPSDRTMLSPSSSSPVPGSTDEFSNSLSQGPTKRRKTAMFNKAVLPTPVNSSQIDAVEKNITALGDDDDDVSKQVERPTAVSRRLFPRRSRPTLPTDDSSSDELVIATSETGKPSRLPSRFHTGAKEDNEPIDLGLTDEERPQTMVISSSEDETDHLERVAEAFSTQPSPNTPATPPTSRPKSSRRARPGHVVSDHDSDSDQEADSKDQLPSSPIKSKKSRNRLKTGHPLSKTGEKEIGSPKNKRSLRSTTMSQRQRQAPKDSSDSDESLSSTSEKISMKARSKKRPSLPDPSDGDDSDLIESKKRTSRERMSRTKPAPIAISDDDETPSGVIATSSRRRRLVRAGHSSPQAQSDSEGSSVENEVLEDVQDLKDTELRNHRTRATNPTPKKSKFQQHLEILKNRRAGKDVVDLDAGSAGSADNIAPHGAQDLSEEQPSDASFEEADDEPQPRQKTEDLDQYDEDFVVEDDDDPIGVPADLSEMPLEFTRHAHKKPIEHFKDAVEWMVHNKLNPAFARNDPVYHIAVQKLNDEVQGLAGSKFMSAAWNAEFMSTLKARPEIAYLDAPGLFEHHCAACNKRNHPAKYQLIFSGKPYNRHSLEEVSDDEDEDGGTDGQSAANARDEKAFYVGRTCCANAETGHALHHWRFALNQYVLEWLGRRGHTKADKIIERERWSTKKRTQYANEVVDGMETSGEMRTLYKEFKENLQAARDVKTDSKNYGRR